jgi:hypothetical protein
LAYIDSPVYKAAPERIRFMYEGQVAGLRETMKFLIGEAQFDEVMRYAGNHGRNFFELQDEAKAKAPGSSFTEFQFHL